MGKCEFKKFLPVFLFARKSKVLGAPLIFLNQHGLLNFLVKACRYWPLEYLRISMKFQGDS